jgi:hypothetical protein
MKTRGFGCGLAVLVLLGEVHGDQPQRLRDLDRGSPMPGASYMVSNMSSASLRISAVTFSTGLTPAATACPAG